MISQRAVAELSMTSLSALLHGFEVALRPGNLMWAFVGVLLGTIVGILPGIGPALTVALLLPVTFHVEPVGAFIMFAGIYYGAMYGGSTTAILMNTPGESGSMITTLDGHKMARTGRASAALATAAIGSFVAGTISTIGLTFVAPAMAELALKFGPAEYFALIVLGVDDDVRLAGRRADSRHGEPVRRAGAGPGRHRSADGEARYTFGVSQLLDGVDVVVVVLGLFAGGRNTLRGVDAARRHGDCEGHRLDVDDRERLEAILETVAPRHAAGVSDRRASRRWRRNPDLSLLLAGETVVGH